MFVFVCFYCIFVLIIMNKKGLLLYIAFMLVFVTTSHAQDYSNSSMNNRLGNNYETNRNGKTDSTQVNTSKIDPKPYQWKVDEQFGDIIKVPMDTIFKNFHSYNLNEGHNGHYNHLGNIGSPRYNRLFFERPTMSPYPFLQCYSNIITLPGEFFFTNSRMPFTNLTYYKSGTQESGEERFKAYFSTNATKNLAVGFLLDYTYGRGYYVYDNTAHFNADLFASYTGDRYKMHLILNYCYLKTAENGGITDDRYITDPQAMAEGQRTYSSEEIPVKYGSEYNAWNRNKMDHLFFTHRYIIGFKRVMRKNKDGSMTVISRDSVNTSGLLSKLGVVSKNDSVTKDTSKVMMHKGKDIKPIMPSGGINKMPQNSQTVGPKGMPMHKPGNDSKPTNAPNIKSDKPKKDPNIIEEYVPVTSFIHTMDIQSNYRRYYHRNEVDSIYKHTYIDTNSESRDSLKYLSVKNVFAIQMMEGFNKWAKAGVTAFISHEYRKYILMDSIKTNGVYSRKDKYNENLLYAGARLTKTQGSSLHFNAIGQFGLLGDAIGQFSVKGTADVNFKLLGDTISLIANGDISNSKPSMFMRHYHGNHYWWDNSFNNIFETKFGGEFTAKRLGTKLKINVDNIKNYTYLGPLSVPVQNSGNIQVLSAQITQDFHLGILHFDNEVTYQKSSNLNALPLPDLSLYHNLYIDYSWSTKLHLQLGGDVTYFSKYYALTYTPDLGMFNTQNETTGTKLGSFPIVNVYLNLHVKHTRWYVEFYNVMHGKSNSMEFYVPHYPINPFIFKVGLSMNLFD